MSLGDYSDSSIASQEIARLKDEWAEERREWVKDNEAAWKCVALEQARVSRLSTRVDELAAMKTIRQAALDLKIAESATLLKMCAFAYEHLESMECYSLVSGARHLLKEVLLQSEKTQEHMIQLEYFMKKPSEGQTVEGKSAAFREYESKSSPSVRRLREALELIAQPARADGTYNRCRAACEKLAKAALSEEKLITAEEFDHRAEAGEDMSEHFSKKSSKEDPRSQLSNKKGSKQ